MRFTNLHNLPESLATVLKWDTYTKRGDFSVTELIRPARAAAIELFHESELSRDVADMVYSRLGTAWAAFCERKMSKVNALPEEALTAEIMVDRYKYLVSGRPDLFEENGTITDWKVTSVWSFLLGSKEDWERQLWLYEWLFRRNGFMVSGLRDVAILRDWSRGRAGDPGYPQVPVFVNIVQAPPMDVIESYLMDRIREHVKARRADLPLCTEGERWHKADIWAVMKEGRKSAVRILDSEEEAKLYMSDNHLNDQHSIVKRPGEDVRCELYCDASRWCTQYQDTLK